MMLLLDLFWTFFRIGLFTFGGGFAMLPLIQEETIAHGWLTEQQIIDFVAVSESTPGPFAINMATYVGSETAGIAGGFFATLGVVLPSFIIILLVAKFFERFQKNRSVKGFMAGVKPAAIGLIGAAVVAVASAVFFPAGVSADVLRSFSFYASLGIFALCLILAFKKIHPILIICISAGLGIVIGYGVGGI